MTCTPWSDIEASLEVPTSELYLWTNEHLPSSTNSFIRNINSLGGHYIGYAKHDQDGSWYEYDDTVRSGHLCQVFGR